MTQEFPNRKNCHSLWLLIICLELNQSKVTWIESCPFWHSLRPRFHNSVKLKSSCSFFSSFCHSFVPCLLVHWYPSCANTTFRPSCSALWANGFRLKRTHFTTLCTHSLHRFLTEGRFLVTFRKEKNKWKKQAQVSKSGFTPNRICSPASWSQIL